MSRDHILIPGAERLEFTIYDFVHESNRIENIHREPTKAEVVATIRFLGEPLLTVTRVIELVQVFQPDAVPRFVPGLDVRVGNHTAPRGGSQIHVDLVALIDRIRDHELTPFQGHCQYETLHPFTDGNGRSGRAIWLWAMGGIERAPLGFLHHFYYQALDGLR